MGAQKSVRVQTRGSGDEPSKANGNKRENQEKSSDASDESPNSEEREGSPDDFKGIRPKTKWNRADEGTSNVPDRANERLIGNWLWISFVFESFNLYVSTKDL